MIKSRMSTAGARVTGMLCAINCFATFLLLFVLIFSTGHSQAMAASPMTVSSLSFKNNQFLPKQFTGDGSDISPAIQWSGAPASTKSFAVICVDPDAPNGRWIHWVIYDIPSTQTRLPDGADSYAHGGHGFRQGTNSFSKIGWNGPALEACTIIFLASMR